MIDTIISNVCKELGLSYIFATVANGKIILNGNRRFPALIRTFGENIEPGKFANEYTSEILIFIADNMTTDENMDKTMNVVRRMQTVTFDFIDKLRRCGIQCTATNMRTAIGDFDAKVAGISMRLKVTYTMCDGC